MSSTSTYESHLEAPPVAATEPVVEAGRNVSDDERALSAVGGGVLLASGLLKGGLFGWATAALGGALVWRGYTGHCSVYDRIGASTYDPTVDARPVELRRAVTAMVSREEAYGFWRNLGNASTFMRHIESVEVLDERRSKWTARLPTGVPLSWEADIIEDVPPERIRWKSTGPAAVEQDGEVRFLDRGERGTEIRVCIVYRPPAGGIGRAAARWLVGLASSQLQEDLHRLEQILETGDLITTEGQPSGPRSGKQQALEGVLARL